MIGKMLAASWLVGFGALFLIITALSTALQEQLGPAVWRQMALDDLAEYRVAVALVEILRGDHLLQQIRRHRLAHLVVDVVERPAQEQAAERAQSAAHDHGGRRTRLDGPTIPILGPGRH